MPAELVWLTPDELVAFNADLVSETGEPHQLRDRGLLESACANPQNRFEYAGETDTLSLAVALLVAVARNHPFAQGNKRTAFVAMAAFLEVNGCSLGGPDGDELGALIVAVLEHQADEGDLIAALRPYLA